MREQLQQYVTLLFAGAQDCEDIQQEILQNTLDHYDDLIAQGKCPEAAYRLAISGIGDINEILSGAPIVETPAPAPAAPEEDTKKKTMRAIAVALYILCPVPVILLGSTGYPALAIAGVCGLLAMVAVATALMILGAEKEEKESEENVPAPLKSIYSIINTVALVLFLVISFLTGAWYITWLIFPIGAAVKKLIRAIYDYKEAGKQ